MTQPNWADMSPDESLLDWLNRTDTDRTWVLNEASGLPMARLGAPETTAYHFWLTPSFTEAQFVAERDRVLGWPVKSRVPPIWPGNDFIRRSTPVALAPGVTITEPMDGVLVHISAVDPKQMWFTYDDVKAYRHIGALAFFSDEDDLEMWQTLGFTDAVYTPRSMEHAAGVKIMTPGGTEGSVTPWVITSGQD